MARARLIAPACWIPSALLASIAISEMIESHAGALTPWKGGGFGMFSTYDSVDNRFIKAFLLTDQGEVPCALPDELSRPETILQTQPGAAKLDDLAAQMLHFHWYRTNEPRAGFESRRIRALFPHLDGASNRPKIIIGRANYAADDRLEPIHVRGARLEVWRWRLNGSTLTAEPWMKTTQSAPAMRPDAE